MNKIIQPIECSQPSFTIDGIYIRTNNLAETDPSTAKIGKLWKDFGQQIAPNMTEKSSVYGVYTNYESDMNGEYDIWVGATNICEADHDLSQFNVSAGRYLKFSTQGEMPAVVIELWQQVWEFFTDPDCLCKRAYSTDYEHYSSATQVDIYIAIK